MKWTTCFFGLSAIPLFYFLIDLYISSKSFIFSPDIIEKIALKALNSASNSSDHDQMFLHIAADLHNQFPLYVKKDIDFVFMYVF